MKNKIYIVTGATGFLGNTLIKKLVAKGETVHALVRNKEKAERALKDLPIDIFYGDVLDAKSLPQLFASSKPNPEYVVVHTAAVVLIDGNKDDIAFMRRVNIEGTQNVVRACLKHQAKLLHISSVHAIAEPKKRAQTHETLVFDSTKIKGAYAKSKAEATQYVLNAIKNRGLDAIVLHPSGITGPGDYTGTHLAQLVTDYLAGRIPAATKGGYDFVDVRDVCDGILAAEEKGKLGECYLLTNRYYPVIEVLGMLYEITGYKKITKVLPMWLAQLGVPFIAMRAKAKNQRPLYTRYSLYTLKSNSNYSHQKAATQLGYAPRDLRESLTDTLAFLADKETEDKKAEQVKLKEAQKIKSEETQKEEVVKSKIEKIEQVEKVEEAVEVAKSTEKPTLSKTSETLTSETNKALISETNETITSKEPEKEPKAVEKNESVVIEKPATPDTSNTIEASDPVEMCNLSTPLAEETTSAVPESFTKETVIPKAEIPNTQPIVEAQEPTQVNTPTDDNPQPVAETPETKPQPVAETLETKPEPIKIKDEPIASDTSKETPKPTEVTEAPKTNPEPTEKVDDNSNTWF